MAEFIVNPRRAPRAPARCRATVVATQGLIEAESEDIGSMGCQLVSPKRVPKGEQVRIHVSNEKVGETLEVAGRVAWVSPQAPWRIGIAFDEASQGESARWFDQLVAAYPGLGGFRRVPDRIRADASVYLGPPPKFLVDFTGEEAMLLRAIASGARIDELMARLRDRWPAAQRALFSLIARQAVTLQRGQAVHPDSWKKVLSEVEASLALDEMGKGSATVVAPPAPVRPREAPSATPVPGWPGREAPSATPVPAWTGREAPSATPVPAWTGRHTPSATPAPGLARPGATRALEPGRPSPQAHDPAPLLELEEDDEAPLEVATPAAAASWGDPGRGHPQPDFSGAGVGWRRSGARSPDAQAAFERALAELRVGSVNGAIALLRRALALAPGDPEIAAELGKLAFRDRT